MRETERIGVTPCKPDLGHLGPDSRTGFVLSSFLFRGRGGAVMSVFSRFFLLWPNPAATHPSKIAPFGAVAHGAATFAQDRIPHTFALLQIFLLPKWRTKTKMKKGNLEDRLGTVLGRSWVCRTVLGSCLVVSYWKRCPFVKHYVFEKIRCQEATWIHLEPILGRFGSPRRVQNESRGGSEEELS